MKKSLKILLCFVLLLLICGCTNKEEKWKNIFQVSEIKLHDNYIIGKIKNMTDKAYDITIYFELKSGSLVEEEYSLITIKPNETRSIKEAVYDYDESYQVKIKKIKYEEIQIPILNYDDISVEALEYHFEDIYNNHLLITEFRRKLKFDEKLEYYPYIDEIKYQSYDETIDITYSYLDSEAFSSIYISDNYSVKNGKLQSLYINIYNYDEKIIDQAVDSIVLNVTSDYDEYSLIKYYLKKDIDSGKCWKTSDWCVSRHANEDGSIKFWFELNN